MWTYRAVVVRWVDGDTLDVTIDLGFYVTTAQRLRLMASGQGVNAPETNATDPGTRLRAHQATERCNGLAPPGTAFVARTARDKADSFGRFLGEVVLADGRSVGDVLLAEGLAVPYRRGGRAVSADDA